MINKKTLLSLVYLGTIILVIMLPKYSHAECEERFTEYQGSETILSRATGHISQDGYYYRFTNLHQDFSMNDTSIKHKTDNSRPLLKKLDPDLKLSKARLLGDSSFQPLIYDTHKKHDEAWNILFINRDTLHNLENTGISSQSPNNLIVATVNQELNLEDAFVAGHVKDTNSSFGGLSANLSTDSDENIIISGSLKGNVIVGESEYNLDSPHAFIAKFDDQGNYQWSKIIGGANSLPSGLAVDEEKNIYMGLNLEGVFEHPEDTVSKDGLLEVLLIFNIKPNGEYGEWIQKIGPLSSWGLEDMVYNAGQLVFSFNLQEEYELENDSVFEPPVVGAGNSIIAELNPENGRMGWAQHLKGGGRDILLQMRVLNQNSYMVAGRFTEYIKLGDEHYTLPEGADARSNGYLMSFDNNGNIIESFHSQSKEFSQMLLPKEMNQLEDCIIGYGEYKKSGKFPGFSFDEENGEEKRLYFKSDLTGFKSKETNLNEQPSGSPEVDIWPNPVNDHLKIRLPSPLSNKASISFYTIDGRFISEKQVEGGINEMNFSDIDQGLIIWKVIDENQNLIDRGRLISN